MGGGEASSERDFSPLLSHGEGTWPLTFFNTKSARTCIPINFASGSNMFFRRTTNPNPETQCSTVCWQNGSN